VACHEQTVDVIERQRVQQHVAASETPGVDERQRIAREIAVAQHRTLGAAGRTRGVEDCRQVVRCGNDRVEGLGLIARELEQGAFAAGKRQDSRFRPERGDRGGAFRSADNDARLGIAEKIRQLAFLVPRVQRQIGKSRAQARQIERERLPALVDLRRDAIAFFAARAEENVSDARSHRVEVVIVNHRASGMEDARLLVVFGEVIAQQRVQVGVHSCGNRDAVKPGRASRRLQHAPPARRQGGICRAQNGSPLSYQNERGRRTI